MPNMRINHMELTFPEGTLTDQKKQDISAFYKALFEWDSLEVDVVGQQTLLLMVDPEVSQFILCAESPKPMHSPGYDHMGLLMDNRADVDMLLDRCKSLKQQYPDIELKEYDDLVQGPTTTHAFYVRYLLPIWFDVQVIEYEPGTEPAKRWHYG